MTTNSQLSTSEPKKQKQKLTKQLDQEQNREMEITWRVFSGEQEGENVGEKVQGLRSIIGRHKIDGERLRMVQETENSKNLYVQPMDMN